MIDAKELRLGNKIQVFTDIVEVTDIGDDGIVGTTAYFDGRMGCCGCTCEMAKGIALTPEILEKCGLEPITSTMDDDDPDYASPGWRAYYPASYMEGGKDYFCIWDDQPRGYMMDGFSSAPLQYLHQLQNLFYCLTGQELEVNL